MNQKLIRAFTISWAFASLLGAAAGSGLGLLLTWLLTQWMGSPGAVEILSLFTLLAGMGLGMGIAQGMVLRPFLPWRGWWPVVTVAGWLFALSVDLTIRRVVALPDWVLFALVGGYLGTMQWLVIFRRLPYAALWIPANLCVWVLIYGGLSWLGSLGGASGENALLAMLVWSAAGGLSGLITGPLMQFLVSSPAARGQVSQ